MKRTLIVFLQALLFALPSVATEPDLTKVLAGVQAKYDKMKIFTGEFTQVYTHKKLKRKDTSEGSVKFKKKKDQSLMRWDYSKPSLKSYMVDDKSALWIYSPSEKSAQVNRCFKQDSLTASLSFLWGDGKISKLFNSKKFDGHFGAAPDFEVELTPIEKSPHFEKIILVIDVKNSLVKQSILVDQQGNTNQFTYKNVVFNDKKGIEDSAFSPPKGIAVSNLPGTEKNCKAVKKEK